MYYTYILRLSSNKYYIGYSSNLKQRLAEHNQGLVLTTKNIPSKKLIYYCAFITKKKAIDFEKYLKSSSGFAFRNKHLI